MGDVIGDLNSRRGTIQAMDERSGARVVKALVPLSEMFGYVGDLRSRTQGRASYTMVFDSYAEVPANVARRSRQGDRRVTDGGHGPRHPARPPQSTHHLRTHERGTSGQGPSSSGPSRTSTSAPWAHRPRETTLTAAITKVLHRQVPEPQRGLGVRPDRQGARGEARGITISIAPSSTRRGSPLRARRLPRARRLHQEHDHRAAQMDGAIWWSRRPDGPMPQTKENVLLGRSRSESHCRRAQQADMVDDEEILELVESRSASCCPEYEFPGDDSPWCASALKAREATRSGQQAPGSYGRGRHYAIPEPEREIDKPFLMPVEDVFHDHRAERSSRPSSVHRQGLRGDRDSRYPRETRPRRPSPASRCSASCSTRVGRRQRGPRFAASSARTSSAARSS